MLLLPSLLPAEFLNIVRKCSLVCGQGKTYPWPLLLPLLAPFPSKTLLFPAPELVMEPRALLS